MTAGDRRGRLAYTAWVAVCLIWGTTYLAIRVALETIPPALLTGLRWSIAGGLLALYVRARGNALPPPRQWGHLALLGLLLIVVGNGLVVWAEQWVPSGLTAVLLASSPFWMVGVEAVLRGGERITARSLVGLTLGFSGILLLVWPDLRLGGGANGFVAGVGGLQVACAGWAAGSAWSRRHARETSLLSSTAMQMLFGGLTLVLAGTALDEWRAITFNPRTFWAFAYLTTIGSIGGFVSYAYALKHLPVSTVSLYAYINPVIAVALGVMILDEPFSPRMALAAVLVFAGVAVVRWTRQTGRPLTSRTRNSTIAITSRT